MALKDHPDVFDGLPHESLFYKPILDTEHRYASPVLLFDVFGMKDDRLLAIVSALLIENRVDYLLSTCLPRYKKLLDTKDFTFSTKITLVEALGMIPPKITSTAHLLRQIRNEFAHHLSAKTFNDVEQKLITRLFSVHGSLFPNPEKTVGDLVDRRLFLRFYNLVEYCVFGFDNYAVNIRYLRAKLREPDFVPSLHREAETKGRERLLKMMNDLIADLQGASATAAAASAVQESKASSDTRSTGDNLDEK